MELDLDQLTQAAARGDRAAVDLLLERYLPEVRAFVRLRAGPLLRARESSSDLVQSVCREALEHLDRFRHPGEAAFKHWLMTTALRKIRHRREFYLAEKRDVLREIAIDARTSTAADPSLLGLYGSFSTPSAHAAVHEELERIELAFDQLTEEQREVITLAHLAGLTRAEIAARMDKSEGAVRVLLHRALARLSTLLGTRRGDP